MTQPDDDDTAPETTTPDNGSDRADTVSDPGMESGTSTDWSSEGGAVAEGPATDPDDADPNRAGGDDDGDA